MKKHIGTLLLASALTALSGTAQNTATGYFQSGYTYAFQLNPALGCSVDGDARARNFVGMPALGNTDVAMRGSLHMSSILYKVDGRTVTFMSPDVSASEVLSGLKTVNKVQADVRVTALAGGWRAWGGYNTVAVSARANVSAKVPRSLFSFLKEGVGNSVYDIDGVGATANAFAEVAFNHSRPVGREWQIGGAVKVLLGAGNVNARLDRANLTLGEDLWTITTNAHIRSSVKGLSYKTKLNDNTHHHYVNGARVEGGGVNGVGLGFDLGAVYKPKALPDWQFSAAILDLGFIAWNNDVLATTYGDRTFQTDRYTFNADGDAPNSFENEWKHVRDDLTALYELDDAGDQGSRTTPLAATVNVGVRYTFPLYRRLTFGLLNTTRLQGKYGWTDFRLSANVAPSRIFSASVSASAGTFGMGFGWLLNLHVTGFNLYAGMDHTLGKVVKQYVPLNSNGSLNLGMNFLF